MARQVSRPIRSARVNGPMGWFIPSFIAGQNFGDCRQTAIDKLLLDVAHDHIQTAHGCYLGDTISHLAGANNTECFDLQHS